MINVAQVGSGKKVGFQFGFEAGEMSCHNGEMSCHNGETSCHNGETSCHNRGIVVS